MTTTLRLVLGDQLNSLHSWYSTVSPQILYVLMEVKSEATYARHHIQKLLGFFGAMRFFAEELQARGHRVHYLRLDAPENRHSIAENVRALIEHFAIERFEYQLPDEYRVDQELRQLCAALPIPSGAADSEHFLTSRDDLRLLFKGKKSYLMETFYRSMRRKTGYLMDAGDPIGGAWNFDSENRKKLPSTVAVPPYMTFAHDLSSIASMIETAGIPSLGTVDAARFEWPLTRQESLQVLSYFCDHLLPLFGTYQDAMHTDYPELFHSRLSFALNTKMLSPAEVVESAIAAWKRNQSLISLPQIEGFLRQIIGWREYMRGVYWASMPAYRSLNVLNHTRPLPHYYWDGNTKMNCMRHAIGQSLSLAHAHHIQRLMVTGNFALLAGVHPDEVDAWYLGVYIDAIEWVEITNTRGMSQWADGGIVGSKPYVASANYINKMSNYCEKCFYRKEEKHGDRACPFNSLYWHFYHRHRSRFEKNPRVSMMYRVLDKMERQERQKVLAQAEAYLEGIERL